MAAIIFEEFGKELRAFRTGSHIKDPKTFADELGGMSKETLRLWEVGKRLPNHDNLMNFLKICGVSQKEIDRMVDWRNELAVERDGTKAPKYIAPKRVDVVVDKIVKYIVELCAENDLEMPISLQSEVKADFRKMIGEELGST